MEITGRSAFQIHVSSFGKLTNTTVERAKEMEMEEMEGTSPGLLVLDHGVDLVSTPLSFLILPYLI